MQKLLRFFRIRKYLNQKCSRGAIQGLLAGGAVGAITGALIGAVVGVVTGGVGAIGAAALVGATYGFGILGNLGTLAGAVTGVVKSREAAAPSAADVVGVAKATFAQGIAVGVQLAKEQETAQTSTTFRDKITQERAAQASQQRVH